MKAITIRQPWASLIALGAKRIETRSWATNYRGPIAIHASAKFHPSDHMIAMTTPEMSPWLSLVGVGNLPLGEVIATATLVECVPTATGWMADILIGRKDFHGTEHELVFGDFGDFRYGWLLKDVTPIDPVPAKGRLGLWDWEAKP